MQTEEIYFNEEIVETMRDDQQTNWVVLRPICENIGLEWSGQLKKIARNPERFNCLSMTAVAKDNKNRTMICIPLSNLNGFLFSINANRCKLNIREKLIIYQHNCSQALYEFWNTGIAVATQEQIENNIALMEQINVKDNEIIFKDCEITKLEQEKKKLKNGKGFAWSEKYRVERELQADITELSLEKQNLIIEHERDTQTLIVKQENNRQNLISEGRNVINGLKNQITNLQNEKNNQQTLNHTLQYKVNRLSSFITSLKETINNFKL